jgi:hypothetical protein
MIVQRVERKIDTIDRDLVRLRNQKGLHAKQAIASRVQQFVC